VPYSIPGGSGSQLFDSDSLIESAQNDARLGYGLNISGVNGSGSCTGSGIDTGSGCDGSGNGGASVVESVPPYATAGVPPIGPIFTRLLPSATASATATATANDTGSGSGSGGGGLSATQPLPPPVFNIKGNESGVWIGNLALLAPKMGDYVRFLYVKMCYM
jgi:hypothetical protein